MTSGTRGAVSSCENGNLYQADFCKEMLEQMLARFFKGHVWTSRHVGNIVKIISHRLVSLSW